MPKNDKNVQKFWKYLFSINKVIFTEMLALLVSTLRDNIMNLFLSRFYTILSSFQDTFEQYL